MIVKSQEISSKKKDFFLNKVIVLYGENQDLVNDLNDQIISLYAVNNQNSKIIFEDDVLKKHVPKLRTRTIINDVCFND